MKILFLTPYPHGQAPSQRFRFEQYLLLLKEKVVSFQYEPFLNEKAWKILYQPGHQVTKIGAIAKGFFKRVLLLFQINKFNYVFIHREAAPLGPPIFEWAIAKILRKKVIYDFDDAIWLPNTSEENKWATRLKWHQKVASICRWSYKVSCGNQYLYDYAAQFNPNVVLNPTTIDTVHLHNPALLLEGSQILPLDVREKHDKNSMDSKEPLKKLVIGWTGTHSTLPYLDEIIPVLQELGKHYKFTFVVIANKAPDLELESFQFVKWAKETEIKDLLHLNIGLMPLTNDAWAQGKCGFKALQYMALGIPALVSPIGVNAEIVDDGINGFHCRTAADWKKNIILLLENAGLRNRMGKAGREKVEQQYSVKANEANFLSLFS